MEPALQNRKATNVFLVGPTGTGKTSTAKQVLEAHFDGRAACVNCWKYRTAHEVLSEILLTFRIPAYARESVGEQVRKLEKLAKSKSLVVYLDEVDRLVDRDLLYVLSRVGIGLVLSSTHYHTLSSLPSRITSSLGLSEIQFPKYTVEETIAIVRDRVEQSVRPGALRTSLLKLSAVLADGDARVALETIRRAALMAEHNNSKRIELSYFDNHSQAVFPRASFYVVGKPSPAWNDPLVARSLEKLLLDFASPESIKVARSIPEKDFSIREENRHALAADIGNTTVDINLEAQTIAHHCPIWAKSSLEQKFCPHVVKLFLSIGPERARTTLALLLSDLDSWKLSHNDRFALI